MKTTNCILTVLIIVFSFSTSGLLAQTKPVEENDYDIGGKMTIYPKVDWLKGTPVTEFKKDSIYVVDLWATWCKPCIALMPHLSKLSTQFKGKINFIAQNVLEDDKEKVMAFMKKTGFNWDLKVAYGGDKNSDFHKKWTQPAGVFAIPQTYIIKNNILLWQTYPNYINEEILQLVIDGKFTVEKAEAIAIKDHLKD